MKLANTQRRQPPVTKMTCEDEEAEGVGLRVTRALLSPDTHSVLVARRRAQVCVAAATADRPKRIQDMRGSRQRGDPSSYSIAQTEEVVRELGQGGKRHVTDSKC